MNPLTQSKNTTTLPVFIALTLGYFALSPQARAVCQQGCLINENTVLGDDALVSNTTGIDNVATGFLALSSNTAGNDNTATGFSALALNTTGSDNTAIGWKALSNNTSGRLNTATGVEALPSNTTGIGNMANGNIALFRNTTGDANTAVGVSALFNNSTGNRNTGVGSETLKKNNGSDNIAIGYEAGMNIRTGNNTICIGHPGDTSDTNTIRIGTTAVQTATFIAGISGVTVPTGVPVIVDSTGHLGTTASSARCKEGIKPMDKASEAIFALKPVTFRYKKDLDPEGVAQFGLVAEEVDKVNPDLVACDEQGKPYTVRYEAVNAMLLNEFLKAHRKIEEQGALIAQQQKDIQALAAGLQRVSAQFELSKAAPRAVNNP